MADLEGKSFAGLEVVTRLGEGGMGTVYKARQPILKRFVALKVIAPWVAQDPAYVTRFQYEAVAAAQLNHPNIVQVYNAGEHDKLHYLVEEFVEGESLQQRLDRETKVNPQEAVAICIYVAEALDYAWREAKLIHRDIKPANILLSSKGAVKVVDLGLAKRVGGDANPSLTQSGTTVGTPYYCSPEQAQGAKDIDFRSDIYSLGCTLYHMLSGKKPYEEESHQTPLSIMIKHVTQPPPAILEVLPNCPPALVPFLNKMLSKKPEDRFHSYAEFIEAMRQVYARMSLDSVSNNPKLTEEIRELSSKFGEAKKSTVAGTPKAVPTTQVATETPPQRAAASAKPPSKQPAAAPRTPAKTPAAEMSPVVVYTAAAGTAVAAVLLVGLLIWAPWRQQPEAAPKTDTKQESPATPSTPATPGGADSSAKLPAAAPSPSVSTPTPATATAAAPTSPQTGTPPPPGQPYVTSIGMEMVYVATGEFMMGSTAEERAWAVESGASARFLKFEGEKPRQVAIERSYWLGRTEVTVGQWKQFASATNYVTDGEKKGESFTYDPATKSWSTVKGANWRKPNSAATLTDNHPVSCISWNDAAAFCEWLSNREQAAGRLPPGYKICLPTEAEWEYACRAGKQSGRFWWGDAKDDGQGRLNWNAAADGAGLLVPVDHHGARGRNDFGLADMLGNVWEWCQDGFDPDGAHARAYSGDISQRVIRGGSANVGPGYVRCAYRCGRAATDSDGDIGFRVACSAK